MTIYTVIIGKYDFLKDPLVVTPGWDYICFTDQDITSEKWKVIRLDAKGNERTLSKEIKLKPWLYIDDPNTIYIDGSFYINCNLNEWWKRHKTGRISLMQHPWRNCPYDEIREVLKTGKDDPQTLKLAKKMLQDAGVLPNSGQAASGIIMRDNSPDTIKFCESWMEFYLQMGKRDQISWAMVNNMMPKVCFRFQYDYRRQFSFMHVPHNNRPEKQAARLQFYKLKGLL